MFKTSYYVMKGVIQMTIDVHVHPAFYDPICKSPEQVDTRKKIMGYDLMSPFPLELVNKQLAYAKIDKLVLLPEDSSTIDGAVAITNEDIATLVRLDPQRYIGFASVDPNRPDALEVLRYAFDTLGLKGLKLHPAKDRFYPDDPKLFPIYELCLARNLPITFHCGMSWQPNTYMKYCHPFQFEEVAIRYPELRINLAHFGFPWVTETAAIILKYPNVYADTAGCYMDCPEQFFEHIFMKQMGPLWIEHNIREKILFGSNSPRFRPQRIKRGLESLPLSEETKAMILGENAVKFLGLEG